MDRLFTLFISSLFAYINFSTLIKALKDGVCDKRYGSACFRDTEPFNYWLNCIVWAGLGLMCVYIAISVL
jgi:hypothetical protein